MKRTVTGPLVAILLALMTPVAASAQSIAASGAAPTAEVAHVEDDASISWHYIATVALAYGGQIRMADVPCVIRHDGADCQLLLSNGEWTDHDVVFKGAKDGLLVFWLKARSPLPYMACLNAAKGEDLTWNEEP